MESKVKAQKKMNSIEIIRRRFIPLLRVSLISFKKINAKANLFPVVVA